MDPAIIDYCRIGYFRIGVFRDDWENLKNQFENFGSLDATRRRLWLGSRDATTGWYAKHFSEEDIEMVIIPRASSQMALRIGTYVRVEYLGLTADPMEEDDEIKKDGRYYEVEAVRPIYSVGGDSFAYRECDLTFLPFQNLRGGPYTASSVEDARYRTKDYLETYLRTANLPNFIVAYGEPDYPLVRVFKTKGIDVVFSVGIPNSSPLLGHDQTPYGYEEHMPIEVSCIDKSNIDGTQLLWNAIAELRYVAETYPTGSQRSLEVMRPTTKRLGSTILHSQETVLSYRRGTT